MCTAMNITVKVTAAESPFSNGLVERHNFIITDMMDKTLEESQFSLDLVLSWCLNCQKLTCKRLWVLTFTTGPRAKPKATVNIY